MKESDFFSARPFAAADAELLQRAASWKADKSEFSDLNVSRLAAITALHGIEFATALVHERALRAPANARFMKRARSARPTPQRREDLPDLIGVVPGAFHREHRNTGADGARIFRIARDLGCEAETIPVASFGSLEINAQEIARWLQSRRHRRIVLVSLSKGGSDVKRALALPGASQDFAHVRAWVSFSGIVQGTALIAWLRARPFRWWGVRLLLRLRGHPTRTLGELRRGPNTPLAGWPAVPPKLRIIHLCGVPLRRHLQHEWAPRAYDRLAPLGPNDGGGILLGDLSRLPGIVVPVWGADHYLDPSWDIMPLLRNVVLEGAGSDDPLHANQSAVAPISAPAAKSTA